MMAKQMMKHVLPTPRFRQIGNIKPQLGLPALIRMQSRKWCLAYQRTSHVKIVTILVGPRPSDRIVVGHRIGFTHNNMLTKLWPTRNLVRRTGPRRLAAQGRIEPHQSSRPLHHFRVGIALIQMRMRFGHHPIIGPGRNRERRPVVQHELSKIQMRLPIVKTRIDMGIGDRDEVRGIEDARGLHHKLHGKLQGRTVVAGEDVFFDGGKVHPPRLARTRN